MKVTQVSQSCRVSIYLHSKSFDWFLYKSNTGIYIEISQLMCTANQLTGFYIEPTLAINGLISHRKIKSHFTFLSITCVFKKVMFQLELRNIMKISFLLSSFTCRH